MNKREPIILICDCHSTEHQLIIREDIEEEGYKEAYVSIYLREKSFFNRLKLGIKYIFGYKSKYGAFDEILLSKNNTKQLKEMLDRWDND